MMQAYRQQIDYVRHLKARGAAMVTAESKEAGAAPPADLGIFGSAPYPAFEFGKSYEQGEVFSYNGQPGYIKQAHTSSEAWVPFTPGTEALYGARPKMQPDGTFSYVYNMAADVGMLVRQGDKLYRCIQAISDMLYPPDALPAHFVEESEGGEMM